LGKRKRKIHKRPNKMTKKGKNGWEKVPKCTSKKHEKKKYKGEKWGAKIAKKVHQRDRMDENK
jgi:hypothetical protein